MSADVNVTTGKINLIKNKGNSVIRKNCVVVSSFVGASARFDRKKV
mgnify:CR=1 FL=1